MNQADYSPPNVNYWGDRCCKAEAENERLRAALITAAQWMPTPGSEYTEEAKADVRQVQEALGWIPHNSDYPRRPLMSDDDMLEYGLVLQRRMQWIWWLLGFAPRPKRRLKK